MNDHPIDAVREARRKISEEFDHDPRRLVEHYKELQRRHEDHVISPGSKPPETEEAASSTEPDAIRK